VGGWGFLCVFLLGWGGVGRGARPPAAPPPPPPPPPPPRFSERGLANQRPIRATDDAWHSEFVRSPGNEIARLRCHCPRPMVVRRHDEPVARQPPACGCQQRHRVEPAGYGEHNPLTASEGSLDRAFHERDHRVGVRHSEKIVAARRPVASRRLLNYTVLRSRKSHTRHSRSPRLETHGPLGTLWVSIALGCFYIALVWVNTLLGFFLTPLFVIPMTWVLDLFESRKQDSKSA